MAGVCTDTIGAAAISCILMCIENQKSLRAGADSLSLQIKLSTHLLAIFSPIEVSFPMRVYLTRETYLPTGR